MGNYNVAATTFVAREEECRRLTAAAKATTSQFIAVYGRRRVGKTLLIREAFGYSFTFQHAGLADGDLHQQLFAFESSLREAGLADFENPKNWLEAFELLKELIRTSSNPRKVVFIDELSWMDTPRCDLMTALEWFWNGWASARKDVVLVVCASATSWMLNKVVHNKGGLYNRLTAIIALRPFTLKECEDLLEAKGVVLSRSQILEGYMALGGVPYYWDLLQRGLSIAQGIDALFFEESAPLSHEFTYLFSSLFNKPEGYVEVVRMLATRKAGMTREEILEANGLQSSGSVTKVLADLENCGFVRRYHPYGKKERASIYQLIDNFSLFHHKFLAGRRKDERFWSNQVNAPSLSSWRGVAFERVCLEHVPQIKAALGVSGVLSDVCSWTCKADADSGVHGSQIDLLIARADHVINLCEMKYSQREYAPTRSDEESIRHKVSDFQAVTRSRDAIHPTLVTTYGLSDNRYSGAFSSVVTAEDLFA